MMKKPIFTIIFAVIDVALLAMILLSLKPPRVNVIAENFPDQEYVLDEKEGE